MSNTAKIRLMIGAVEVEYEGEASFMKEDLTAILEDALRIYKSHLGSDAAGLDKLHGRAAAQVPNSKKNRNELDSDHSTSTIAAHIGAKTAPDLAMAAAARLGICSKKASFSRSDILSEMKGATTYYTAHMRSNLTNILDGLVKSKRLNQIRPGEYALAAAEKIALETRLAEIG